MSKDGRTDRQTDMTDGQTNLEVSETLILFYFLLTQLGSVAAFPFGVDLLTGANVSSFSTLLAAKEEH